MQPAPPPSSLQGLAVTTNTMRGSAIACAITDWSHAFAGPPFFLVCDFFSAGSTSNLPDLEAIGGIPFGGFVCKSLLLALAWRTAFVLLAVLAGDSSSEPSWPEGVAGRTFL